MSPVPPLATGRAVPDNVTESVPEVVIGLPETLKNEGTLNATEVTVPVLLDPFDAAVMSPLAFTVMFAFVNDPTLLFTVARVKAPELTIEASPDIATAAG